MIVDLSVAIEDGMSVYPGDPEVKIREWASIGRDGYFMNTISMGEHTGTHVDAPAHFVEGGKTVDELPLERFTGPGKVVRVEGPITAEHVREAGTLEGFIVLFLTNGRGFLTKEAAVELVRMNVRAVGIDTPSIDRDGSAHRVLLSNDIPIFENLTNLDALLGREFTFIAFPLRIKGGSGSPVRAVAVL
nr:cyclase family protein [Palaeococcus ferrophilus]